MADESKVLNFKNDETGARFAVREGSLAHERMTRAGAGFTKVGSLKGGPDVRKLPRTADAAEQRRAESLAQALAGAFKGGGTGQSDQGEPKQGGS